MTSVVSNCASRNLGMTSPDSIYESLYESFTKVSTCDTLNDLDRGINLVCGSCDTEKQGCYQSKLLPESVGSILATSSRLTDDDNYMLKSCDGRPRSASLSHVSRSAKAAAGSTSAGPRSLPASANPAQPKLVAHGGVTLATAATQRSTSTALDSLICSCSPSCCCKCTLVSSFVECQAVFHHVCAPYAQSQPCSPADSPAENQPPPTVPQDVPISQWTSTNVVEWMAALNLYRYVELFRSKDIKGVDLLSLDKDKLLNMGVKDEFHQKAILVCVDELCQRSTSRESKENNLVDTGDNLAISHQHRLGETSFSSLERCDKCHKYLRGLVHQGLICHVCGLVAHRSCAATGLPICLPSNYDFSNRLFGRTVFGVGLCRLFNPSEQAVPTVVMRLVQEVESRARANISLDLYRLYRTTSSPESVAELRSRLCEAQISGSELDLSSYDVPVLANVLKRYLRELPDPVIPVQWYERFIEAARNPRDDLCTAQLSQLVQQLPVHHQSVLRYLLGHICRLCQFQHSRGRTEPPTLLTQVFCHIFLRPPWERIIQVVHNGEVHLRILELLLFRCDWGETMPDFASPPSLPPRGHSRPPSHPVASSDAADASRPLAECEWYWGSITREEVSELMRDAPDGTFLVRNASNNKSGEYTLTLRKGGQSKLIKICHRNGKYGFSEPCQFKSVPELISFYSGTSLAQYNPTLDTKLLYPVSRFLHTLLAEDVGVNNGDVDKVIQRWLEVHNEYLARSRLYDNYYEDFSKTLQELQLKKQAYDAFGEAVAMFEEQMRIHEKYQRDAHRHEINSLMENYELLKSRLAALRESRELLEEHLRHQAAYNRSLDREMNALKPELHQLAKTRDQLQIWLDRQGVSQESLTRLLEQSGQASDPSNSSSVSGTSTPRKSIGVSGSATGSVPRGFSNPGFEAESESFAWHVDSTRWLLPDCNREEAERLLRHRPDGTFLVRRSTNAAAPYALSIVCNKTVGHCLILRSERGYGFAEPYLIFPTLKDLVVHYATNSLEEHNNQLTTTLAHPVYGGSPKVQADDKYMTLQTPSHHQ